MEQLRVWSTPQGRTPDNFCPRDSLPCTGMSTYVTFGLMCPGEDVTCEHYLPPQHCYCPQPWFAHATLGSAVQRSSYRKKTTSLKLRLGRLEARLCRLETSLGRREASVSSIEITLGRPDHWKPVRLENSFF